MTFPYYWSDQELMEYNHETKRLRDESVILQHKVQSAKIEVAKNLLKVGVAIDVISQSTELAINEIEKLKKETVI